MKVDLCPDSWTKVEALIGRAAFDEREHLLTIARKVAGCKCQRCRRAAAQLRAAVKSTDPWTWFQDVLK